MVIRRGRIGIIIIVLSVFVHTTGCCVCANRLPPPVTLPDGERALPKNQRIDHEGLDLPEYLEDAFVYREASFFVHINSCNNVPACHFWKKLLTRSMAPLKYEYMTKLCLYWKGPESHFRRGFLMDILGYDDLAAIEYTEAIGMAPDDDRYYNNRGNNLLVRGYPFYAIADFTRAIEINPGKAEPYYNRGRALERIGDYEGARRDYEKAVELGICEKYPSLKIC